MRRLLLLLLALAAGGAALRGAGGCCEPGARYDAAVWACVPDNATDALTEPPLATDEETVESFYNGSEAATSEAGVTWPDEEDTGAPENATTDWEVLLANATDAWAADAAALTMLVPEGCDRGALVDVPQGQALPEGGARCLAGDGLARVCVDPERYCKAHYCLPKCCPHGQSLMGRKECLPSGLGLPLWGDLRLPAGARREGVALVASGVSCVKYPLQPDRMPQSDVRRLVRDDSAPGRLALEVPAVDERHTLGTYCLEFVDMPPTMHGVYAFVCFPDDLTNDIDLKHKLESVGLVLSVACLGFTLAVYACLPTLQNLHGRTLMCHIAALLAAYIGLAVLKIFTTRLPQAPCTVIGVLTLFFFLAAFSWLTIMCFDIWWTFGPFKKNGVNVLD